APRMQGENPLANPLARVPAGYSLRSPFGPASGCYSRWSFPSLPNPIEHTRPRGIHAPGHSFGVIQTMLLALANVGLERMGREKPQQIEKLMRPAAGRIFSFGFCAKRTIS